MMSRTRGTLLLWPLVIAVSDFIVFFAATMLAYWVRFHSPFTSLVPASLGVPGVDHYTFAGLFAASFWVLFMAFRGVYRVRWRESFTRELGRTLSSFYLGFALLFALIYFYRNFSYSRVAAVLLFLLATLGLMLTRWLLFRIRRRVFRNQPPQRVIIIGGTDSPYYSRLRELHHAGLIVVDQIGDEDQIVGSPELLAERIRSNEIDTVILAYSFDRFARAREIIDGLAGMRLDFLLAPDPKGLPTGRIQAFNLAGVPLLQLREEPLAGWNGLLKRVVDVLVSGFLLVLSSPLLLLIPAAVKLTSRGPVIYRQTRVGLDGRTFTIYKFRTMRTDAEEQSGPVWARRDDSRTTPLGRFLRRWSLDEIPQLWNVFRGDMSLVGPRPERPVFVEQFRQQVPRYAERHRVRSGLTGWAQVNGLRGQAPIEERTRYDLFYIENWSLWFDFTILARTLIAVLFGRDAY